MAFPTVAGVGQAGLTPAATSVTVNFDTTPTTGDLMIAVLHFPVDSGTVTFPSGFGTWTVLSNTLSTARLIVAYKTANGEGSSMSVSWVNSSRLSYAVFRYTVSTFTGTPEVGTAATGTSANPNSPNLAPSWGSADNSWLAIGAMRSSITTVSTWPTGFGDNNITQTSGGTGTGVSTLAVSRDDLAASSLNPSAYTFAASNAWIAQTVGVKGVSAAFIAAPPVLVTRIARQRASVY